MVSQGNVNFIIISLCHVDIEVNSESEIYDYEGGLQIVLFNESVSKQIWCLLIIVYFKCVLCSFTRYYALLLVVKETIQFFVKTPLLIITTFVLLN